MKTQMFNIEIEGIRPYIMHNGRLANALDPHSKSLKKATSSKNKTTDDGQEEIQYLEFVGGLYHDPEAGPYVPTDVLQALVEKGATRHKLGKAFKAHVGVEDPMDIPGYRLEFKGPRTIEGMWKERNTFVFVKGCRVGQSRVMRTRPRFPAGWKCAFQVEILAGGVSEDDLKTAVQSAGLYEGIGDWRPRYGRFIISKFESV